MSTFHISCFYIRKNLPIWNRFPAKSTKKAEHKQFILALLAAGLETLHSPLSHPRNNGVSNDALKFAGFKQNSPTSLTAAKSPYFSRLAGYPKKKIIITATHCQQNFNVNAAFITMHSNFSFEELQILDLQQKLHKKKKKIIIWKKIQ